MSCNVFEQKHNDLYKTIYTLQPWQIYTYNVRSQLKYVFITILQYCSALNILMLPFLDSLLYNAKIAADYFSTCRWTDYPFRWSIG